MICSQKIVGLQLGRIVDRIKDNHGIDLHYTPEVLKLITSRCTEVESGGRMIDAILTNTVLPQISRELLTCATQGKQVLSVNIDASNHDFTYQYKYKPPQEKCFIILDNIKKNLAFLINCNKPIYFYSSHILCD